MTRGGVGEVNNPAGGARGGGGVRGVEIFIQGGQEGLNIFKLSASI